MDEESSDDRGGSELVLSSAYAGVRPDGESNEVREAAEERAEATEERVPTLIEGRVGAAWACREIVNT